MKRLHIIRTVVEHAKSPRPPDGFDLSTEEKAGGPVYFREHVEEIDQPDRVDADGAAHDGDDELVEDQAE